MISILDAIPGANGPSLADRMHLAFSQEGKLAESSQFEFRPQQQQMAQLVADALEKNRALICEAATGVGKSLAYLVPAATYAKEQGRKAIICTHTINLQEQLIHKDIPIVKKIVGDFHAELLKGRNNYICPTRLKNAFSNTGDLFSTSEAAELQLIMEWQREHAERDGLHPRRTPLVHGAQRAACLHAAPLPSRQRLRVSGRPPSHGRCGCAGAEPHTLLHPARFSRGSARR
jgi:ATP-dependent DNA helicase DinG